jgi:hypothetical protein
MIGITIALVTLAFYIAYSLTKIWQLEKTCYQLNKCVQQLAERVSNLTGRKE